MVRDLRPLVSRNATNGISLAEAHRDQIYGWFEEWGLGEGVEILLVKSPAFSPAVWVAVETWLPVGAPGMTKRARVEIELVPRDFCRWPIELEVVLKESPRTRVYFGVVDFTRENAAALLRYLLGQSPNAEFGFKYCRARFEARNKPETTTVGYQTGTASRMRLVFAPLQFWHPRNRPLGLKRDVIGKIPTLLMIFAAIGGLGAPGGEGALVHSTGGAFVLHLIAGAIVVGAAMYMLDISALRAWQFLSDSRGAAVPPSDPAGAVRVDADARRDMHGVVALTIMFLLSLVLIDPTNNRDEPAQWHSTALVVFVSLAVLVWVLNRYRRRLIWSSGRPEGDPRILLRLDSWQALLIGLSSERNAVHDAIAVELKSTADAKWSVTDERIWYWGVDGKEERQQTVVSFRSALAFLQFNPYGSDLYVAWDAHINRGTWTEKSIGSGTSAETNALCEVHTIVPAHRLVSEYDVSDANSVLERVHAVVTRVLRLKLAEHKLDQEIDFTIVRERRVGLTGDKAEEPRGEPRLSLAGFRRKA